MPIAGQGGECGDVLSLRHVGASVTRDTPGTLNLAHHGFQLVDPSRSKHHGCASSGQQKGRRAADATACASNRNYFPVDACHVAASFEETILTQRTFANVRMSPRGSPSIYDADLSSVHGCRPLLVGSEPHNRR